MSNWATLYRQKTRLPVVPAGVDPRSTWFHCNRYDANLPRVACANRYKLSRQRTGDGASYQAITYGGCVRCKIGAAHAAGLPTPQETPTMEETTTSNGHATKQWPARACRRCAAEFTPKTARERLCSSCEGKPYQRPDRRAAADADAAKPARRNGKRRKAGKLRGRKLVSATAADIQASTDRTHWPADVAPAPRALQPSQISTAAELLELAGYTVKSVRTPAGLFLQVS